MANSNHVPAGQSSCTPSHFRRLNRRGFLTVGAVTGAASLTLGDFFRVQQAKAELKQYAAIEAKAKSIIHIFLPGGMAHQESFDPKPYAPIEYRGEMGQVQTEDRRGDVRRYAAEDGSSGGSALRNPFDDARRGGPRARDAQHVHRVSPESGAAIS